MNDVIDVSKIEMMIFTVRGQKVMLDSDLAKLYGVPTKRLNEQVKRNIKRFPQDFMIQCDSSELDDLRSQIATTNDVSTWDHMRRTPPMLFTENGVAMLSSVLNSDRAIEVNISIMRIFTKLRSFLLLENELTKKVNKLENETTHLFRVVFERLDTLEVKQTALPKERKKIGLKAKLKE